MAVVARGKIRLWDGIGLWLLKGETASSNVELHAHHAVQLTLCLVGAFELKAGAARLSGPAAIVAADIPHEFWGHGTVAFLFVEPESAIDRLRTSSPRRPASALPRCATLRCMMTGWNGPSAIS